MAGEGEHELAQTALPQGAEMRAAPRFSLMIRAAKLVGTRGEYLCVVRDVSATGTRLRLFHEAPQEAHLFLELGSGDRFAVERVWERDSHAGFRFAAPIDVEAFIEEPRSHQRKGLRLKIERPGLVHASGLAAPAMMRDISQQGARIDTGMFLAVEELLRLEVDGLPPRVAKVRWRREQSYGLIFEETFRLDELARHAHALASKPITLSRAEECRPGDSVLRA